MDDKLGVIPIFVLHDLLIAVGDLFNWSPIVETATRVNIKAKRGKVIGLRVLDWEEETAKVVLLKLEIELNLAMVE